MIEPTATGPDSDGEKNHLGALAPSQILYLQQGEQRLYVELIQILRDRNMGWLRPLCLCSPVTHPIVQTPHVNSQSIELIQSSSDAPSSTHIICDGITFKLQDMRQSADLLWPLTQCQIVLDIEAIPILTGLGPEPTPWETREETRQSLNVFMNRMWSGTTSG